MTKAIKNAAALLVVTAVAGISFSASAASGYTHARTLKVGSRGLAVESLQEALNTCWDAGISTDGNFGRGTRAAVIAAQKDLGLKADGIVGSMTGSEIEDCDGEAEGTTTTTTTTTTGGFVAGGGPEVRIRNFQIKNASQSSIEEGARGVEVARLQFDTQYSDAKLERIDIYARANGVTSPTTPWRVFDKINVVSGGTTIGTVDSSNSTMWDDMGSGIYRLRVSGMSAVLKKDMSQYITLTSDINSGANGTSGDVKWDLYLGTDAQGVRLLDQAGITQYTGLAGTVNGTNQNSGANVTNASTVTIKNIGALTTIKVQVGSSDPSSKTLMAKKTASSEGMLVQSYTIKAEDGDVKIKTLPVVLALTEVSGGTQATTAASDYGALYKAVIDSSWVEINGTKFDSISSKSSTDNTTFETNTINFDINRNVVISKGSTATVNVMVKLASLPDVSAGVANVNAGVAIAASTPSTSLYAFETAQGDSVGSSSFTGSATGYTHTIRTTGIVATMGTASYSKVTNTNGLVTSVEYTIPVTLQAFGDTYYTGQTVQYADTATSTNAVAVGLQTSAAPTTSATLPAGYSTVLTMNSNAPITGSALRFDDGTARTATVKITLTGDLSAATTSYRAALKQIRFFSDSGLSTGGTNISLLPAENFRSDYQLID